MLTLKSTKAEVCSYNDTNALEEFNKVYPLNTDQILFCASAVSNSSSRSPNSSSSTPPSSTSSNSTSSLSSSNSSQTSFSSSVSSSQSSSIVEEVLGWTNSNSNSSNYTKNSVSSTKSNSSNNNVKEEVLGWTNGNKIPQAGGLNIILPLLMIGGGVIILARKTQAK